MFFRNNDKDNQINKEVFNTSTIEHLEDAKDKDFHSKFFTSDRVTFWIGVFGQFLSAITEALFIFRGVGGELPVLQFKNLVAVTAALIGVYFFEVIGVRVYLISIVRQITNKDFKTEDKAKNSAQKITLFVFNICFCSSILFANFATSLTGQSTTFISAKSSIDNSDTLTKINIQLQSDIDTVRANAVKLIDKIELSSELKTKSIKDTYKPILKDLKATKWDEGANKKKIKEDIVKMNNEQIGKLEAITKELKNRIIQVDTTKENTIASLTNIAQLKKDAINKSANADTSIYEIVESYSYYLLLVFMSLSILAIIYREVYISGSKQELKTIEVKKRPLLIPVLLYGLYMKLYHFFYWLTVKIVGSKAFDYSKVMQSKDDYLSSEVSTNEALKNALNYIMQLRKGKQEQERKLAGFQNSNNTTVTNCATTQLGDISEQKKTALNRYKISTIQMQYKRSNLVKESLSIKLETQQTNTDKYKAAKVDLEQYGVKFVEGRNSVSIIV
jgi:hypothetical protein